MQNHTELLNYLATTFNLQSYLEIGVQNPANNFDKIQLHNSVVKFGVDPEIKPTHSLFKETSDEFFAGNEGWKAYFDLIFIDGLHHADQVKRDFENSLHCLNEGGFIVIHDTLPAKEEYTHVPRDSKIWNGDVYKFACSLVNYDGIDYCTIPFDHGCTIIWKDEFQKGLRSKFKPVTSWQQFQKVKYYLNIVEAAELQQFLREETNLKFNSKQLS